MTNISTHQRMIPLLQKWTPLLLILVLTLLLSGCMATRTDIRGSYPRVVSDNFGAEPVTVLFHFKHFSQQKGFDAIPKLTNTNVMQRNPFGAIVQKNAFNNILLDALKEFSNIDKYETFTEVASDVNDPERRETLNTLSSSQDYTLEIEFLEESSFKQLAFSGLISTLSATLVPMPYSWNYTMTANLRDKKGSLLRTYERSATLDNWIELFLMFAYPFHPIEGKREEIYSLILHDLFKEIESEKILK
jgi:hypothetical protein